VWEQYLEARAQKRSCLSPSTKWTKPTGTAVHQNQNAGPVPRRAETRPDAPHPDQIRRPAHGAASRTCLPPQAHANTDQTGRPRLIVSPGKTTPPGVADASSDSVLATAGSSVGRVGHRNGARPGRGTVHARAPKGSSQSVRPSRPLASSLSTRVLGCPETVSEVEFLERTEEEGMKPPSVRVPADDVPDATANTAPRRGRLLPSRQRPPGGRAPSSTPPRSTGRGSADRDVRPARSGTDRACYQARPLVHVGTCALDAGTTARHVGLADSREKCGRMRRSRWRHEP
jgi:hypothetical protein